VVSLAVAEDDAFAGALGAAGVFTDPWVDGASRFRRQPLPISAAQHRALARAAEQVASVYHELCQLVAADAALLEFFGLTPVQTLLWHSAAPFWHGVARADVFFVEQAGGSQPVVCELNCDTPTGQPEAVLLGPAAGVPAARDPNAGLAARFMHLVGACAAALDRPDRRAPPTIGIVYPTELTDDLALVHLYQRWCGERGLEVVLGSPYNLQPRADGGVALFGTPCDLILRHYKTDWWSERLPIWDDEEPYPDPDPLDQPLAMLLRAQLARRCAVLNPFAAVVPQNKKAMAFMWEEQARFSPQAQAIIRAHVPQTTRLQSISRQRLAAEREDWVLKSDYGCEGEEVVIGRAVTPALWEETLAHALPDRWVAQRHFTAVSGADGQIVNHGVYLVGGQAAGLYARLSPGATDRSALSVAVEVVP
jgi:hypothetical protein